VLDRFNGAAVELQAERVIRVTADCPLVDPELVERLLTLRESAGTVYAAVATGPPIAERSPRRYPDGLDSEVFSATALERAAAEATDAWDREHVTPYIKRELAADSCALLEAEEDWADERWTVDYPEDLAFAKSVYDHFGDTPFGYRDVFELLEREPRLRQINAIRAA
jgi:spore coat polysaccharide biosynthesis protein SpsF (cytidylyltransferase family)